MTIAGQVMPGRFRRTVSPSEAISGLCCNAAGTVGVLVPIIEDLVPPSGIEYTAFSIQSSRLLLDYFWTDVPAAGTLALTEQADTNSAAGTTTVVGTLALTEAADVNAASGTAGSGSVDGTLALTEAADTNAATGTTTILGTSSLTEALDTNAASGTTTVRGASALTEALDTNAASGTTTVVAALPLTEAADTNAASGTTTVLGTLALTEAADSFTFTGDAGAPQVVAGGGAARPRMRYERIELDAKLSNDELAKLLIGVLELV